ncbi:MAG: helix-turn-helix transcriptional regulator [Desulfobacteraceae bacterium]
MEKMALKIKGVELILMELSPERLKEIRKELGLTQAEFGEKIGYAAGSIRNMETGQQSISNRATMAVDNLKQA